MILTLDQWLAGGVSLLIVFIRRQRVIIICMRNLWNGYESSGSVAVWCYSSRMHIHSMWSIPSHGSIYIKMIICKFPLWLHYNLLNTISFNLLIIIYSIVAHAHTHTLSYDRGYTLYVIIYGSHSVKQYTGFFVVLLC